MAILLLATPLLAQPRLPQPPQMQLSMVIAQIPFLCNPGNLMLSVPLVRLAMTIQGAAETRLTWRVLPMPIGLPHPEMTTSCTLVGATPTLVISALNGLSLHMSVVSMLFVGTELSCMFLTRQNLTLVLTLLVIVLVT